MTMGNLFHLETLFPALDDIVQVETDYEENLFQAEKWKKKHAEMLTLHQQGTFFRSSNYRIQQSLIKS